MNVNKAHKAQMVKRAVSKGQNQKQAEARFDEFVKYHEGDNLVFALVSWGYATEAQAYKFVEAWNKK